jgi:Ca2+-binding EF-hand superfamily protein
MRAVAVVFCVLVGLVAANARGGPEQTQVGPVLQFPSAKGPFRLRLEVALDGASSTTPWERFLDNLFDFFDRDGDGSLSQVEVGRMPPLPLPRGRELTIDFAQLDADGDGKGTRAELKSFCRRHGFAPVIAIVEPPSAEDVSLADIILRRLDIDGDGKLTRDELRGAPQRLRKYDLNEDEYLEVSELLAGSSPAADPGSAQIELSDPGATAEGVLRLDLGVHARATVEGNRQYLSLATAPDFPGVHRWHGPDSRWSLTVRTARRTPEMRSAREFLVALFKEALGDQQALPRAAVEREPTLSGLQELFRYADRNGDERLDLAELEGYLQLVEKGVAAQVWVTVRDHGRNPFPFLDTDGDGRLSYQEVARAPDLLAGAATVCDGPQRHYEISLRGPQATSWGGVPLPAVIRKGGKASVEGLRPPAWFAAMDVNRDGVISPREFLGPLEVFRKLDADGDGVISLEEALRASDR